MQKTLTRPTTLDSMPACLKADDVAAVLGVSRAHAYNLINSDGFPRLAVGKRLIVPKAAFMRWMESNTVTGCVQ